MNSVAITKIQAAIIAAIIIIAAIAGVVYYLMLPTGPTVPEKIVIGWTTSLSGAYSAHTEYSREAVRLWLDKVNAEGGIYVAEYDKRLPVEVTMYDDESDPDVAVRLYEKMITVEGIKMFLGPWGSTLNTAVAPLADKYHVPIIVACGASPSIYERGQEWLFYVGCTTDVYNKAPIALFKNLEPPPRTFAIVSLKQPWPTACAESLEKEIRKNPDWELVYIGWYETGTADFSPIISELIALNPDVVINPCYFEDGTLFAKQAKEMGLRPKLFFNYIAHMTDFVDAMGEDAEGFFGIQDTGWNLETGVDIHWFLENYRERYGREPNPCYSGFPFIALQVWKQAIEKAGTITDTEKLRDVLLTEKFETLWGPNTYFDAITTEEGKVRKYIYPEAWGAVCQIQNGEILFVWPPECQETEPWYPYEYFSS